MLTKQNQKYKSFYYELKLGSWYSKFSTLYNFPNTLIGNQNAFSKILTNAIEPNQYSRLSCQIEFKKEYDNITVTIAPD